MNPALLPVRTRLGPRPRHDLLVDVRPEVRTKVPASLKDTLARAPLFGQVDCHRRAPGWGFDLTRFVSLAEAEAVGWAGEA